MDSRIVHGERTFTSAPRRRGPLIIVGAGRSGSTLLHDQLSRHKSLAWLPNTTHQLPDRPLYAKRSLQAIDLPLLGPAFRRLVSPSEAYSFWDHVAPGFRRPFRDLRADDVTPRTLSRVQSAFSQIPTQRRTCIVLKVTGWPRIGYLRALFPDAHIVHLVRDGRAVAASFLRWNTDQWWGWRGPENWRYGPLPERYLRIWESSGKSFVALAGIQWNIILDAVRTVGDASAMPDQEIRYEDLCRDPAGVISSVLSPLGLLPDASITRSISRTEFRSTDTQWESDLSESQQNLLGDIMNDNLRRYGYLV